MCNQVNMCPSLSASSPLDQRIKNMLMNDVFHLVGFTPDDAALVKDPATAAVVDNIVVSTGAGVGRGRGVTASSSQAPVFQHA